jgi:hypothetical protein
VASEHEYVVVISALGLGNDVPSGTVLGDGVDIEDCVNSSGGDGCKKGGAARLINTNWIEVS